MKVKIKFSVVKDSGSCTAELSDIGFTETEWYGMSEEEQDIAIQEYIDGIGDQPYWLVDSFEAV